MCKLFVFHSDFFLGARGLVVFVVFVLSGLEDAGGSALVVEASSIVASSRVGAQLPLLSPSMRIVKRRHECERTAAQHGARIERRSTPSRAK